MVKLSSTQIGAIGESIVANELMLRSNGRLSPFTPVADDDGIDLLVYDKWCHQTLPLQVKSRRNRRSPKTGQVRATIQFDLSKRTWRSGPPVHLLAVLLDESAREIERAWLIPMFRIPMVSSQNSQRFTIRPSPKLKSQDRYSQYRCRSSLEVSDRILRILTAAAQQGAAADTS